MAVSRSGQTGRGQLALSPPDDFRLPASATACRRHPCCDIQTAAQFSTSASPPLGKASTNTISMASRRVAKAFDYVQYGLSIGLFGTFVRSDVVAAGNKAPS